MKEELCRTAMLLGEENVVKIEKSRICVFGLGGVGSYTVEALARSGVGELTLVDCDTVSLSNINRQLYALHSTVGQKKTEVAKQRIYDINPDCKVNIISELVTEENIDIFFASQYDFCVDAIDDTKAKTAIAVKCKEKNIPLIASMGTGSKLCPEKFVITDIFKTENCPLCRVMRRKYKDADIKKVTVLYSPELPTENRYPQEENTQKKVPSSISFVPSVAGLRIAGYVINTLVK